MFKLYIGVAASAAVAAVLLPSVFNPLTTQAGPPGVGVNNHVDTRFDWQSKKFGEINLYWYEGSLTDNPNIESFLVDWYIRDAWTAMWKTQILLDVRLPHPLHIYMYKDWEDIRVFRNNSDSQHIVGFTVDRDTVLVRGDLGDVRVSDAIRHEIAHLVMFEALWSNKDGEYKYAPLWLHEGVAQLAEYFYFFDFSLSGVRDWVVADGYIPPVCAMTEYPQRVEDVHNFYGKSVVLVSLLLQQGGVDDFAELVAKLKRGWAMRWALNGTYGFTDHGLEERWLALIGLGGQVQPETCPT